MSVIDQAKAFSMSALQKAQRMIARGRVGVVNALLSGQIVISLDRKDNHEGAEYWQQFGFAARPPAGGEVLYILVNGNERQPIAIAGRDLRFMPQDLALGDSALFAQVDTDRAEVRTKADGNVDLSSPGAGKTVNVGGDDEFLILGDSLKSRLDALYISMTTKPPPPSLQDVIDALIAFSLNASALLAEKGKVK